MEKFLYSFTARDDNGNNHNISVYQEYMNGIADRKNMKTDDGHHVQPKDGKSEEGPYICPELDDLTLYRIEEADANAECTC